MPAFLAAIPPAIAATTAATAPVAVPAAATGLTVAASAVPAAVTAGTSITGLAASSAAAAALPTIGAGVGALTPAAAGAAVSAGTAVGTAASVAGSVMPVVGALAGAGNAIYSAEQERQGLKTQAKAEAKVTRARMAAYQDKVRQVLSLNQADAAARGVVGDGSTAAVQTSVLEGGQIDLGTMSADMNSRLSLYDAARKRARTRGYAGAGLSLFNAYGTV